MRCIKFRGKKKSTGEWIYGDICKNMSGDINIMPNSFYMSVIHNDEEEMSYDMEKDGLAIGGWFPVHTFTVTEFSGLFDKNGKEIYEGDIIELTNQNNEKIKVICKFGTVEREIVGFEINLCSITGFYFELENGKKTFPIVNNYAGVNDLELFEVVSNIFE